MDDDKIVVYHNPRCSKSRETMSILEDNNKSVEVIEYLKQPPDRQTLEDIIAKLSLSPRDLIRTGEQAFQDAGFNIDSMSDSDIIEAICAHPMLLQRPIVVCGNKAVIGRPPTKILDII